MKKKCFMLVAAVLFSLQITGCGAINLTTQEKNVIAEYIANILLKHDKTYEPTFQYELEEEIVEEPEQKPAEKPLKDKKEDEESIKKESTTNSSKNNKGKQKYVAISTVYKNNLKLSSSGYSFYKTYPQKVNAILPIEASSGKTICIVNLKLKNSSASSKKINFLKDNRYSYQLEVDSKKTYRALQSLLIDDIQYLDIELKSGKSHQAMIAFEIPEKAKKKPLKLLVTKGSNTAALKLK